MQPRVSNTITLLLAQARRKLDEAKELQFFGGDALNLKRYEQVFNHPASDGSDHCWRIVMTPTQPGHTIPIDVGVKPGDATSTDTSQLERVPTTNGTFEYLVMSQQNFVVTPVKTEFYVTYSGAATFNVTQLH